MALDLSVDPWDPQAVEWAEAIGFSVPMHTAMRLAIRAAVAARQQRPGLPIVFYGLYAPVSRDLTVGRVADRAIAGEYEPALVRWVDELTGRQPRSAGDPVSVELGRSGFRLPARRLLPALERYAHLETGDDHRLVGYVEASHGCVHRCRHCPVPIVYDGRIRVVEPDVIVEDVAQLVAMGAEHVTFGDPDFLNGPHHARRVVAAVHEAFPRITFDCTVKVEHILRHEGIWDEMAAAGCLFVVSAFECTNDDVLERLDKGHTRADMSRAVAVLRAAGIEPRPSFLPFTPWTSLGDMTDLLTFVDEHDLVGNIDPVQLSIRLLLPEGSLLLDRGDLRPFLRGYDADKLSYQWVAADPAVDRLQQEVAALAAEADGAVDVLPRMADAVWEAAGAPARPLVGVRGRPRLTEPWFC